jgi:hypothetical protein
MEMHEWWKNGNLPQMLMVRVIKFVLQTENFCREIRRKFENKNCNLNVFCGSDLDGDPEIMSSVMGLIVYLMNIPVCCRSKAQRGVTLSSSEAEYITF